MPSEQTNTATRAEWRDLGFYAESDKHTRTWRLTGSTEGLLKFRDLLVAYVADPRNATVSEHEHYGPYGSLEIMTWHEAGMDDHSIHGRLEDLGRLASLVEQALANTQPGAVLRIREQYSAGSAYALLLDVRESAFDPASADPWIGMDNR